MKKLILASLSCVLLIACSNSTKQVTANDLVGEWSCTAEYKDLGVGTVDLLKLDANGSMKDENYIFDHQLSSITFNKPINDYFSSPFKYLRINKGKWHLENNQLTYNLTPVSFKRIIFHDVWENIQQSDFLKREEAKIFNIYSSTQGNDEPIKLEFKRFIKNGFIVTQKLADRSYDSICTSKRAAKFEVSERLEIYKQMHNIK
ncbi:hypothetical protein EDC44_11441 [Cricetibacter osteomyelitidis]|uniref:Lipoprotein n=1 Tax=Cricetibacter osteomyelitidis TaxID=1521931 RepID=A0A4R2TCH9_9PAST|nr:hypothetical protein [Cricetibacter osteomyelitidis]TCP94798.1 hypothetical protein EDC44_11441 [Cricetibacter osteomyelitidis]